MEIERCHTLQFPDWFKCKAKMKLKLNIVSGGQQFLIHQLEKSYSLLPICICFLKIAYEGKEMRAVADELKEIDVHVPKVPQQKGSTECGFMVFYFIFRFILAAPASFGTNDYPSFLTTEWFSRKEYEKFREDLQGKRIHIDARCASTSKVVKRGPTMLRSVHGLQCNERIPVKINQMGQPLGEGGQLLKQFLGTVARMGDKLPIDCISWRLMPSSNKNDVWDFI
ncbi:hypothetical protein Taro_050677 [Colocasia esculenta]|uniref:Ubiquitin-like protease family profile domain-containing protein n=1 Tax=Colocasia esculenta TaxID=4460 RepID=A0A843XEN1_COLES|nr:hypothetical protein [Colocasia esculenta]